MMKAKKVAALILFVLCLAAGFSIARLKPLWNDEVYSQQFSVQQLSFPSILLGKIPEGNNCPMFYVVQKIISGVFQCTVPPEVAVGEWKDARAQVILRAPAVVFMSSAVAAIFYFFARLSWGWGIYSLLVTLSSFTVWGYWAEARPYALWFLLTTLQSLAVVQIFLNKNEGRGWPILGWIHLCLSLTVMFGAAQIVVVSALLWIYKRRGVKAYIFLSVVPVTLSIFYFLNAPHYQFTLPPRLGLLIGLNIFLDQWVWISCYLMLTVMLFLFGQDKRLRQAIAEGVYTAYVVAMTLIACAVLGMLKAQANSQGFEFTYRYLIFLTPLGIVGSVLACRRIFEWAQQDLWLKVNFFIGLAGLLVLRMFKAVILILGLFK